MQLAFYKGRKNYLDRAVQWWTRGPYSHVEIVFSDGVAASASMRDGGVRIKMIDFDPERWDLFEVGGDEQAVRQWFLEHQGYPYDLFGLFGFLYRPHRNDEGRWFCSEAVAASFGMRDPWRFCPNTLAVLLKE